MAKYFRLYLGKNHAFAPECFDEGFIGTDFDIKVDLAGRLPETFREFNAEFIPILQKSHPEKNNRSAGLACGMLWTVSKYIPVGGYVVCPTGQGAYRIGKVVSEYYFISGGNLPHRRRVEWLPSTLEKSAFSQPLLNSMGSVATVCDISKYAEELDPLVGVATGNTTLSEDEAIGDSAVFALEKYLEDFLITNWPITPFGQTHVIYEVDGEQQGRQLQTDTGPLDILAEAKDGSEMLVIELKRGQAPTSVIGQLLSYMAWVKETIARKDQAVRGVIVALEDDLRIRRALQMVNGVDFYRYEIKFNLNKVTVS